MSAKLTSLFEEQMDCLTASFDTVLDLALAQYERLQQEGKKGELTHGYLSFLTSSVLCQLPWIRMDLYDQNDRCDMIPCSVEWDIAPVSDRMYRDARLMQQKNSLRIYELEALWLREAKQYEEALGQFLPVILRRSSCAMYVHLTWYFGQFLGESFQCFPHESTYDMEAFPLKRSEDEIF